MWSEWLNMRNQVLLELRADLINNKKLLWLKYYQNYKHINFALTISIYRKLNTIAFDNGGYFLDIITEMRK